MHGFVEHEVNIGDVIINIFCSALSGRYEEEFIEHRMNQLQSFVDRVCRHPVLSQSEVFQHFLTCTDDKRLVII